MAGLRFRDIESNPLEVLDLTSLTLVEFRTVLTPFETAFHFYMSKWTIEGKPRNERAYSTYKNCPLPAPEDRLLFILAYLKNNPLQVYHARMFGMRQPKCNMWIHALLPVLRSALLRLGDLPSRSLTDLAKKLDTSPPLFVMTEPSEGFHAPRTLINRPFSIAERRRAIR
jgi:hypothetical protein